MVGYMFILLGVLMVLLPLRDGYLLQEAQTLTDHSEILHLKSVVDGLVSLTQDMQNEIASKNDVVQFLQTSVNTLNASLQLEMSRRDALDRQVQDLQSRQRNFTRTNGNISSDIGSLQQQTTSLQTEVRDTKQQMSSLSTQNYQLNQTVQGQLQKLSNNLSFVQYSLTNMSDKLSADHCLYFTASRPATLQMQTGIRQRLDFMQVKGSNVTGYNATSGMFTAPWDGSYWFGVTLTSQVHHSGSVHCVILQHATFTFLSITAKIGGRMNTNFATLFLNAGDFLTFECTGNGSIDGYMTSFSGFYISSK